VGAGGEQIVEAGAVASGLTASGGGEEYVVAGGTASAAIIGSGGLEAVFGIDRGGTISHGTQYDYGTVSGGTIISAGEQIVEAGAAASGMTVGSGGLEYLVSGGTAAATTISGGTLEVASGGTASGVVFSSGGILQLDSSSHLSGTISGFHLGDEIDLRGLAFSSSSSTVSWTQTTSGANASGTLTVKEGTSSTTLPLVGSYTVSNFSATSDVHGGTLITDPPITSGAVVTNSGTGSGNEGIAGEPGSGTTVHSGGYEFGGGTGPTDGSIRQLDLLLSQIAGVISGFDLEDEIGPHSLGFGSSSSATSWGASARGPGVDKDGNTFNLTLSSVAQTPLIVHH
jgi:autotransporter passenger strand-loop-strand repeat protein